MLITCVVSAVVDVVSNSTTCQHCNPHEDETPARCVVVPVIPVQVRIFGTDLDSHVARNVRYMRIQVWSHGSDGRVRERYHNTSVRRTEAFSQNPAT